MALLAQAKALMRVLHSSNSQARSSHKSKMCQSGRTHRESLVPVRVTKIATYYKDLKHCELDQYAACANDNE